MRFEMRREAGVARRRGVPFCGGGPSVRAVLACVVAAGFAVLGVAGDDGYVLTLGRGERQCVVESVAPEVGGAAPGEDGDVDVVDLSGFGALVAELEVRVGGGGGRRVAKRPAVGVEVWRMVPPGGEVGPDEPVPVPLQAGRAKVLVFSEGMPGAKAVTQSSWRGSDHRGSSQYEVCLLNRASGKGDTQVTVMWNVMAELAEDEEDAAEEGAEGKDAEEEGEGEGEEEEEEEEEVEEDAVDPSLLLPDAGEGERNPDANQRRMEEARARKKKKQEDKKLAESGKPVEGVLVRDDVKLAERSIRKVSKEASELFHAVRLLKIEMRTHEVRVKDGNRLLNAMAGLEFFVVVGIGLLQTFVITAKFKKRGAGAGLADMYGAGPSNGKAISFFDMMAVTLGLKSHNAFLPHQGAGPPGPPTPLHTPSFTQGRTF